MDDAAAPSRGTTRHRAGRDALLSAAAALNLSAVRATGHTPVMRWWLIADQWRDRRTSAPTSRISATRPSPMMVAPETLLTLR